MLKSWLVCELVLPVNKNLMSAPVKQDIHCRVVEGNVWLSHGAGDSEFLARLPVQDLTYEVLPSEEAVGQAMLDEIERFSGRDFYRRLDSVAYDLAKFPESVLYFINYSSPSEKPSVLIRREKLIKGYLAKNHKIEQARMVFVNGGVRGPRRVKIYRIPSKKNWC